MRVGRQRLLKLAFTLFLACGLALTKTDLDRMHSLTLSHYGQQTADRVSQWRSTMQSHSEEQKLIEANDFSNIRIRWVQDPVAWKQQDYWAKPSADPQILDSLIMDIRPASRREDLTPVFGFNSKVLWVGGAAAPATKDPGIKLSRWRDLLQRTAADGLG
jgi:predicted transglutaminase-like cysteine proteinase